MKSMLLCELMEVWFVVVTQEGLDELMEWAVLELVGYGERLVIES